MCNQPMGLQNGRLRNHLMTASSQWDKYHAAFLARLHRRRAGKYMGAWSARSNNRYQYLQIDFTRPSKIIKIATQGRHDADQWVTQYYITYSVNLVNFVEYKKRNNRKVWTFVIIKILCSEKKLAPQGNYVTAFDWENIGSLQIEQVIGHNDH